MGSVMRVVFFLIICVFEWTANAQFGSKYKVVVGK